MDINYYKQYEPIFGSWYITEKIGEGAYGQVYIIERHELGVVYKSALKALTIPSDRNEIKSIMSDGMSEAEVTEYYKGLVHNIVNEFIVMSKLKGNSHIVSYEDHLLVEHEDDIGWDILIRMELLTPLYDHIAGKSMGEREILKLGIDLCKALEFCRKYDIIHRDIKPENIFVAPSGDYKLDDFGIAKTVEKTRISLSRKGTYAYMAPEVYRGAAYGATVDIYSLGVVMYKLLNNNRTPFMPEYPAKITYDDREEALARRIRGEKIKAPENGSEELKEIVLKACAYDSSERFTSASEMRKALEKLFYSCEEDSELTEMDNEKNVELEQEQIKGKQNIVFEIAESDVIQKDSAESDGSKNRIRIITKTLIAVAVLIAIGAIVYAAIPKAPEDITGIDSEETIYIGDSMSPEYKVEPERFADEPISFGTENDGIITVNEKGKITADKVGETMLTLTAGDYSEDVKVKVIAKITGISGIDKTIELTEGDTLTLAPDLSPEKFADEEVTYKIKDSTVADVSKKGKITARAPGTTKLTVSAGGYSLTVEIVVNEYVAPAYTYTPQYSSGSGSSGSSGGSGSSSGSSGTSGSDSSGEGYFNSDDDVYFDDEE